MKKTIFALAAVAALAVGSLGNPTPAEARCHGCGIGLGILGGVAAGGFGRASRNGSADGCARREREQRRLSDARRKRKTGSDGGAHPRRTQESDVNKHLTNPIAPLRAARGVRAEKL